MVSKNYTEYQELLSKWSNFRKVYEAINRAYILGYEDGVEIAKDSRRMATVETLDPVKIPADGMISLESLREATKIMENTILEVRKIINNEG